MATDNQYLQQQLINQDPYSLLDSESVYRNREALGATTPNIDETLGNIPSSTGQFASDVAGVVTNPVQTIDAIGNLGLGLIALAIPDAYQEESLDKPQEAAMAVGQYIADRYGGIDAAKESLKTDPVGVVADVSALLLGGGYLATRGGLKAGQVATQAGLATDPLIVAGRGVGELAGAVSRRDFMKGAGAGIGSLMLPVTNMLSDIKAPIAAAVKSFSPAPFLEKTKAMFDDMDFLSQYRKDKFDLDNTVKNAPSEVRVNMPKIKKIDDGKFEYDLDLEGTSWLDEDPYYMEKVAHQIELDHFKGSGFAPNELQVLDNLDGALYYTKNLDDYKSITPDKADPGSLKTYTPNMDNKEFAYTVDTYTVDGVPVTRQRLPGNSQQAEFIEYTVPGRKALKNKTGEMQQQKLDLPIDSAPTTAAKDIVQAVDDSMTPTERMNALLKEKMGDAEPNAPRAEPTKAEQRIAELDTQLYDINNVLDREGGNMSNVNRAKLKEQKQKLTDELDERKKPPSTELRPEQIRVNELIERKSELLKEEDIDLIDFDEIHVLNDEILKINGSIPESGIKLGAPPSTDAPPSTITRRDALKGMGATGIAALMGTGADIADVATTTTKTAKAAKAAKATINPTPFLNRTKEMFEVFDEYMEDVLPGDLTDGPTDFYDSVNPVRGVEKGTSSRETLQDSADASMEIREMQVFDKADYITEIEESYFKKAGFKQDDLVKIDSRENLNLSSAYDALDPKNADKGSLKIIDGIEDMDRMELSVKTYTIDGVPISYVGDSYDVYYYIMPSKNALMELAK
tara:strand:+ start:10555 stop:12951 length:2397 start_codon:yes stop_codon:yes gene_type:complete